MEADLVENTAVLRVGEGDAIKDQLAEGGTGPRGSACDIAFRSLKEELPHSFQKRQASCDIARHDAEHLQRLH